MKICKGVHNYLYINALGKNKVLCAFYFSLLTLSLCLLLGITSCSSDVEDKADTTETTQTYSISRSGLQGTWLWTAPLYPNSSYSLGTWAHSNCEITPDSIIFREYAEGYNIVTNESMGLVLAEEHIYPYTFTPPSCLHFKGADYLVTPIDDGLRLMSDRDGFELKELENSLKED